MLANDLALIDVRVPEGFELDFRLHNIPLTNSPFDDAILQFLLVDLLVGLLCVSRRVVEALAGLLAMNDDLTCALDVPVGDRQAVLDLHVCAFGEHLLQPVVLLQEQVAVGVCGAACVAGLGQMLDALVAIGIGTLDRRDRVVWLTAAQLLLGNQVSQAE